LEGLECVVQIIAAEKLSKTLEESGYGKDATILDFGCGTGIVGEELYKHGYRAIDGLDICPEILETAKAKGVYGKLSQGTMGSDGCEDLGVSPNQYDASICIGVFSVGHVKGKGFDDLLYVLKPGGLACFTIRDCVANDPRYGYQEKMKELSNEGKWKLVVKSYEKYHKDDPMAWLYIYQKL
jgi:predicted TPR repeat methyltransferase